MLIDFLALPFELQSKILDEFYHNDPERGFGGPFHGRYDDFLAIVNVMPQLWPICIPYLHTWPTRSRPIQHHLIRYVVLEPQLRSAVQALDLTTQVSALKFTKLDEVQLKLLYDYAREAEFLPDHFDVAELSDWVGLALQLLPRVQTLWLSDGDMFGKKSTIQTTLINNRDYLRNLRHVGIQHWGNTEWDVAGVISLLLDIPSLESMRLEDVGTYQFAERILRDEDVEDRANLKRSKCTHFKFQNCFITRHELSIIAARCKPLVLIHHPFGDFNMGEGIEAEEVEAYRAYLEGLASLSSFVQHLEILQITDHNDSISKGPPRMRPRVSTDFSSFKNLSHLTIPIHTLVGEDPFHGQASHLLPPSLKTMRLDQDTLLEESFRWGLGNFLIEVLYILKHKPERFPNLRQLTMDDMLLRADDVELCDLGRPGCLAELFDLAKQYGVILLNEKGKDMTLPEAVEDRWSIRVQEI